MKSSNDIFLPTKLLAICFSVFGILQAQENRVPGPDASYEQLLQFWKAQRPSGTQVLIDAEVRDTGETFEVKSGEDYTLFREKIFKSAKPIRELVMQDNSVGLVYPGSLLWTQPIMEGQLIQLPALPGRRPVKVSLAGITGGPDDPTFAFDGSFYDFQRSSTPVINAIMATAPQFDLKIGIGRSIKSALLDMGLSVSYWGNKFSTSSSEDRVEESSYAVLSLNEVYFTMTSAFPDLDVLDMEVTENNRTEFGKFLINEMRRNGEIGYVRRVNYGRRVLVAISSSSSKTKLKQALRLSAGAFGVGFEGNLDREIKEVWEGMNAEVVIIGGRVTPAIIDAATGGFDSFLQNVNIYLKDTAAYTAQSGSVPISFEVRYLSDDGVFTNYETVEFSGKIPFRTLQSEEIITVEDLRLSLDHTDAVLLNDNADLHSDDLTRVTVSYRFSISEDRRSVDLYLRMGAKELEKNGRDAGKTHIETKKSITVFALKPQDRRKIKKVIVDPIRDKTTLDLRGKLRGYDTFDGGKVGALRNVKVSVDGDGDDLIHQGLQATVKFRVEVAREEP